MICFIRVCGGLLGILWLEKIKNKMQDNFFLNISLCLKTYYIISQNVWFVFVLILQRVCIEMMSQCEDVIYSCMNF